MRLQLKISGGTFYQIQSEIYYTLNVSSRGKQLVFFPESPDVIFLDIHFNSNKRITGANQNSRRHINDNTNLILKTTEWTIYNYFPYIICILFLH